jgi:hypothetical protein
MGNALTSVFHCYIISARTSSLEGITIQGIHPKKGTNEAI